MTDTEDVTAMSADCAQTVDASVTSQSWDEYGRAGARALELIELRNRQADAQRGRRFITKLADGTVAFNSAHSHAALAAELASHERGKRSAKHADELARLLLRVKLQDRSVAAGLYLWLAEEREIAVALIKPEYRRLLSISGAHWRVFFCAGDTCGKQIVVYRQPRACLCSECRAQLRRTRDRSRREEERRAKRIAEGKPAGPPMCCPCGAFLYGKATRRYCSASCRQAAHRMRQIEVSS